MLAIDFLGIEYIFIDEYSMIGLETFFWVDFRLKEISNNFDIKSSFLCYTHHMIFFTDLIQNTTSTEVS